MAAIRIAHTRDIGMPDACQAAGRILCARFVLRRSSDDFGAKIARQHLLALQSHHNSAVRRHARQTCLEFGITASVAVGFTLEGDSA